MVNRQSSVTWPTSRDSVSVTRVARIVIASVLLCVVILERQSSSVAVMSHGSLRMGTSSANNGPVPPTAAFILGGPVATDAAAATAATAAQCPRTCFCNTLSRIVYCSRRGLQAIPETVPSTTVQLNLNGNEFQTPNVDRRNFSTLIDLEHLYMSECGIERIAVDTFADLKALKWLDLSNNRIKVIDDGTFRGVSLQHLFLNGNRHMQLSVGSFQTMSTTGLYLHDCSLSTLSPDVLLPLNSTVRNLWLNGNDLDRVDRRLAPLFMRLQHLRLGANPLHCDCTAGWLKQFYDSNPDVFRNSPSPSCRSPPRMRARLFNETTHDEFRCMPPQLTRVEAVFNGSVGRLVCAAVGDPAPTVYWIQPSGRATRHDAATSATLRTGVLFDDPDNDHDAHHDPNSIGDSSAAESLMVDRTKSGHGHDDVGGDSNAAATSEGENEGVLTVDVTNAAARIHGMYICIAANSAGNVTLTINLPPAGTPLSRLPLASAVSGQPLPLPQVSTVPPVAAVEPHHHPTSSISTPAPFQLLNVRADRRTAVEDPSRDDVDDAVNVPTGTGSRQPRPDHSAGAGLQSVVHRSQLAGGGRLFSLAELVGAVVGTHIATLLSCLLTVWLCYASRCSRRIAQRRARHLYERRARSAAAAAAGASTSGLGVPLCGSTGCSVRGCTGNGETLCHFTGVSSGGCRLSNSVYSSSKLSPVFHSSRCPSPPPEAVYLNGMGHLPYMDYVDLRVANAGRLQRR